MESTKTPERRTNSSQERIAVSESNTDGEPEASKSEGEQSEELVSLVLVRAYEKKNGFSILFNGRLENMNPAQAKLLVALAENIPFEKKTPAERCLYPDLNVDWKSKKYLLARLGITEGAFESRLRRLRRFLAENFGEGLIAKDKKRNARLRLRLRRNPGLVNRTEPVEES